ncbi:hypothetical protein [Streptomyces capparidis]
MATTTRRAMARILPALAPLLLAGALLTGCSDDDSPSDGADAGGPSASGPASRSLAYARCMRENGVPQFPDPDEGGRLKLGPGSGIDPKSQAFADAQDACRDLAPQGGGGPGGSLDSAKVAEWSECIRENGVPEFTDPQVNGGSMEIDLGALGIGPEDDRFQKAMDACQDKWPGGGVMLKGGGAG